MDNISLHQNFMDEELVDFEKSKERIYQIIENDVIDDEFEKVNELTISQIYQSLENEVIDEEFEKVMNEPRFSQIYQSLENEVIDEEFEKVMNESTFSQIYQPLENEVIDDEFEKVMNESTFNQIYQSLENEVIDDEFEKVNESTIKQIYQSLENEVIDDEFEKVNESTIKQIYQSLENEVIDDEFEKVNESTIKQIYQSLENEIHEENKMHLSALNQQVVDQIQSLEDEGMVNREFRIVYLLKKDGAPSFFQNTVFTFFYDARAAIRNLIATLESPIVVDFDFLKKLCFMLKGSSGSIGACTIDYRCSVFLEAVGKKSKDECLQAARNLHQAYRELHTKFTTLMKLEKEIVAAEESALGQQ